MRIRLIGGVFGLCSILSIFAHATTAIPSTDCTVGDYFGTIYHDGRSGPVYTRFSLSAGGQLQGAYVLKPSGQEHVLGNIQNVQRSGQGVATFAWQDKHGTGFAKLQFTPDCQAFSGYWGTQADHVNFPWHGSRAQTESAPAKTLAAWLPKQNTPTATKVMKEEEKSRRSQAVKTVRKRFTYTRENSNRLIKAAPMDWMSGIGGAFQSTAPMPEVDREHYAHIQGNPLKLTIKKPVSTFSIDVDTGAYSNIRRMLKHGQLPRKDAVRVEELINYFSYDYPVPEKLDVPFRVSTEIAPAPWNGSAKLLHIGIQGYRVDNAEVPPSNLVFLIDVSGSMSSRDKLPLLKSSLRLLVKQLRAQDRVAMVVYAGAAGLALASTPGDQKATILAALDELNAGGSTNGGEGIRLAYSIAQQHFIKDGVNRIIIATDGDFNVGTTNFTALKNLVEEKRKSGITLTTLGFGRGNYNDRLMEQLSDAGNGNHAYIDSLMEGKKVLVDELSSTLHMIAKDVKIQIEFNPDQVQTYRLIGYENRQLQREDFNNDKVDAGDIGAGHSVTALYEIVLTGANSLIEPLRYAQAPAPKTIDLSAELAFIKLRYKAPDGDNSHLLEFPLYRKDIQPDLANSSHNFRFSAAVAAFGQQLRGGEYLQGFDYAQILKLVQGAKGDDAWGYRGEFIQLIGLADALSTKVAE